MGDVAPGAGLARRDFLRVGGMLAPRLSPLPLLGACASIGRSLTDFNVEEATIVDIQVAMTAGKLNAESLLQIYLRRIQELDRTGPMLRAVQEINPDALAIARTLAAGRGGRGPGSLPAGSPGVWRGH